MSGKLSGYVLKPGELGEQEKKDMFCILTECDQDFYPPLSARSSTKQLSWVSTSEVHDGVTAYYQVLLGQHNLFWKIQDEIAGFMSFIPHYTCQHLAAYDDVCYLTTLCLSHKFRGMGVSPRIYAATFEYVRENYPEAVIAFRTWSTNAAQMHLVKKLGLTEILRLPDDRGPGVDTIYYVL